MNFKKLMITSAVGAMAMASNVNAQVDAAQVALDDINAQLEAGGYALTIDKMELIASGDGLFMGRTVLASCNNPGISNNCDKRLSTDWSPFDPNRGNPSNLTYAIDTADATSDFAPADQPAVVSWGFETWDEESCSNIGISEVPAPVADLGFVQFIVSGGAEGSPPFNIDLIHGGFLPQPFWDLIACGVPGSGCGQNILGVDFTFTWSGGQDSDGNGRNDTALKENYYNDEFTWVNDGVLGERGDGVFDFATVALHESGHALSRAHFGDVAINNKGALTTTPAAVMNAIYGGVKRSLNGPDRGGHCTDWASWPVQNN